MKENLFMKEVLTRRQVLVRGVQGIGVGVLGTQRTQSVFAHTAGAIARQSRAAGRILVVFELSGGNDGLNTLVPYTDDIYYRLRPNLGLPASSILKIDDQFGFNKGAPGFERLYKEGKMAIIHGCGYENPSFSHFTAMSYWHTAAPNSGAAHGWIGRLADKMDTENSPNFLINIGPTQSLAVKSQGHTPVVFDDPQKFSREHFFQQREMFKEVRLERDISNSSRGFLLDMERSARQSSGLVQEAWKNYSTPVDYGLAQLDLPKIAALIKAEMPTKLYYTGYRNNAFDTHVFQGALHQRLLSYTSDALYGFMRDMERIGRANDVVLMVFSEFGRRVPENVNLGTDHGAANVMFVIGNNVKGGHYGKIPSLANLDSGGNLKHTTDFRRVYASLIKGWLGQENTQDILNGNFKSFDMFG